jgi:hypothetical protein
MSVACMDGISGSFIFHFDGSLIPVLNAFIYFVGFLELGVLHYMAAFAIH